MHWLVALVTAVGEFLLRLRRDRETRQFQHWIKAQQEVDPHILSGGLQRQLGIPDKFGQAFPVSDMCDVWLTLFNPGRGPVYVVSLSLVVSGLSENSANNETAFTSTRVTSAGPPLAPFLLRGGTGTPALIPPGGEATAFAELEGLRIPYTENTRQSRGSACLTLELTFGDSPRTISRLVSFVVSRSAQMEFLGLGP